MVYCIKCNDEKCKDLYVGETSQPLKKRMYQHRRGSTSTSGPDAAVHTHLEESGHHFSVKDVIILDREERWYERGVREAIQESQV